MSSWYEIERYAADRHAALLRQAQQPQLVRAAAGERRLLGSDWLSHVGTILRAAAGWDLGEVRLERDQPSVEEVLV